MSKWYYYQNQISLRSSSCSQKKINLTPSRVDFFIMHPSGQNRQKQSARVRFC